jgi:uncharacterized protein YdaU (DUF1376 family)
MKFYKRFPGDIQIKTGGLTMAEFGAYDRLLDHYYATETPIEPSEVYSITRAITRADRLAVDKVLTKFFSVDQAGHWIQQRADEMIAEAQPKIEAARENGMKGGRPKKGQRKPIKEPIGLFLGTEGEPNSKTSQSQNQSSSEAIASAAGAAAGEEKAEPKSAADLTKAELWRAGKSMLREQGLPQEQCGTFVGALVKQYGDETVVAAVRAAVVTTPADVKEYLKATCQRMKGERRDPVTVETNPQVAETTARLNAESKRDLTVDPERIAAARAAVASIKQSKVAA